MFVNVLCLDLEFIITTLTNNKKAYQLRRHACLTVKCKKNILLQCFPSNWNVIRFRYGSPHTTPWRHTRSPINKDFEVEAAECRWPALLVLQESQRPLNIPGRRGQVRYGSAGRWDAAETRGRKFTWHDLQIIERGLGMSWQGMGWWPGTARRYQNAMNSII